MLRLSHEERPESWDVLAAQVGGSFFHCHAFATFDARAGHARPLFVTISDRTNEPVGVAVGTISTSSRWPYSRFCKIAHFGALPTIRPGSGIDELEVLGELEAHLKRMGVYRYGFASYESRRSDEVLGKLGFEVKDRDRVEFYIDLRPSRDDLFLGLTSARRGHVRRAERRGVTTRVVNDLEGCRLLANLQQESLRHHGFEQESAARRESRARQMKESFCDTNRGRLLVCYLDDAPISASMFGIFNRTAYYVYGGASDSGKRSGGPGHVLWTAMTSLKDEGIESLNLGGCRRPADQGEDSAGVYMFKKDFGGLEVVQPAGSKLISRLGSGLSRIRDRLKGVVGHRR